MREEGGGRSEGGREGSEEGREGSEEGREGGKEMTRREGVKKEGWRRGWGLPTCLSAKSLR